MAAENLLAVSHATDKIYRFDGFTSTVTDSLAYTNPGGVVWKDGDLYWGSFAGSTKKGTGFTTTVQDSYATPGASLIYGMDFIGANVIFANDVSVTKVYQQTGFSATVNSSIVIAGTSFYGVSYDGTNLLTQSNPSGTSKIRKHDGFSTTILDSFTGVGSLLDCSWDGTNMLATKNVNPIQQNLYSGFSSTISNSFTMAAGVTSALGMDWDGFPSAAVTVVRPLSNLLLLGV